MKNKLIKNGCFTCLSKSSLFQIGIALDALTYRTGRRQLKVFRLKHRYHLDSNKTKICAEFFSLDENETR